MDRVDLHVHTDKSDGTCSIDEVVKQAVKANLRAIAITDHDTVEAIPQALELVKEKNLEIIPGIELSAEEQEIEFHVLGYFLNYKSKTLLDKLRLMQKIRRERIGKICKKLTACGCPVSTEEVFSLAQGSYAVGRLHVAKVLILRKYVKTIKDAFDKFLSPGRPAYERKYKLSIEDAIQVINQAGGISVLAHPLVSGGEEIIQDLVDKGLAGIEVYHTEHRDSQSDKLIEIAEKNKLLITGGSDYHGSFRNKIFLGSVTVSYSVVEEMKQLLTPLLD